MCGAFTRDRGGYDEASATRSDASSLPLAFSAVPITLSHLAESQATQADKTGNHVQWMDGAQLGCALRNVMK